MIVEAKPDSSTPRPASPLERERIASLETGPSRDSDLSAIAAALPEIKVTMGLLTAALLISGLYFGRDIVVPLALAFLLGFVLDPLVVRLKRRGLPRVAAVGVVLALATAAIGLAGVVLSNQVTALSAQLPTYQSNIQGKLLDLKARTSTPGMFSGLTTAFDALRAGVDGAVAGGITTGRQQVPVAPIQRVQIEEKSPSMFQQAVPWLEATSGPLATFGLVIVFLVLVLLDRQDLRDRMLRLWGGTLHRSTDAIDDAGERISRYLTMQVLVNLIYGVPLGLGLWMIGVPGALLWGAASVVLRFVPFIGPLISSAFPIALAFAVDPGWGMVLWTVGLIVVLQTISSNIIQPWLYAASTGLSAMSLMFAATFWTAVWGPIGLVMATPLTVCLLVVGRHLPRLKFLDVLLGSQPALTASLRVYQRLLAGDVEEAIEVAAEQSVDGQVSLFYNDTALSVLRMAATDHASVATAAHRHRVVTGMHDLIDDLVEQFPVATAVTKPNVVCIGGKWEVDSLAARMLAHALSRDGIRAEVRQVGSVTSQYIAQLDLQDVKVVCLSYFSPEPQIQARHFCRRLRRRWPDVTIVLGLWSAPPGLLEPDFFKALGADAVANSIGEATMRVTHCLGVHLSQGYLEAGKPADEELRMKAVLASGALDARAQPLFERASKRAADFFDVSMAMVSIISDDRQIIGAASGSLPAADGASAADRGDDLNMPRSRSMCGHVVVAARTLVVPDVARDMRFAGNDALQSKKLRFYAGAPLKDEGEQVVGTLCLLDTEPGPWTRGKSSYWKKWPVT